MIDTLIRGVCLATLAVVTPFRRGVVRFEHGLIRVERGISSRTGALFIVLALIALGGCVPDGGRGAVIAAIGACALVGLATFSYVASVVETPSGERGRRECRLLAGVLVGFALVLINGCAYRERRQTIGRIETECVAALRRAETDDQIDAIEARCHERVREVTDAEKRPKKRKATDAE